MYVNPSVEAHERFQAVRLAAEVLGSAEQRQQYDARGLAALGGGEYKLLQDLMAKVHAQGAAAVVGEAGADISTVLGLEFQEAVTGSACTVTTAALGTCPDCKGSGFDAASSSLDCAMCRGQGELTLKKWVQGGSPRLAVRETCPGCRGSGKSELRLCGRGSGKSELRLCGRGSGKSELRLCGRCSGEGRLAVRRHVKIRVPAGVVDGQVLRVRGQGHCGRFGGRPGDLLVKLQVYSLVGVTRVGDDLHSTLDLQLYQALLGDSVPVKTVRGECHLAVPPGTQHGQLLCAHNAGVAKPGLNGVEYGHHFFKLPGALAAVPADYTNFQNEHGCDPSATLIVRPRTLEDVQAAVAMHDHVMPNAEGHSWNQVGAHM
ncbi:hypothetical protein OEZ85_013938 [Tetradesmus obliquus]|uniref:Chaperone DnaJ C-terminal domain-containing protein n=1 Tax=Tetradesmus obliquus TaxID=3088 RepID=A0ABY8U7E9_TETOB|nr:hypothetical protein OEZ85_013938 [Tetradesmus obliquus]